jgi:hypothetical protein
MASKKCKGKIFFSKTRLKLNSNSASKTHLISQIKDVDVIDLQAWTDKDIYYGKNKSVLHIDYITLELFSHPSYSFESSFSKSSFYSIGFKKLSDFDTFNCVYNEGELEMNGEISFNFGVKDILYNDFKNSGLVLFGEVGVRVGAELLVFDKYGIDWNKRTSELEKYSNEGDSSFAKDRAIVHLI